MPEKVVSFRGFSLNTGGLTTNFPDSVFRPSVTPILAEREGAGPLITRVQETAWQLPPLQILLEGVAPEDLAAVHRNLARTFDGRQSLGALIVADADGDNQRYVMASCASFQREEGKGKRGFVAVLVVSGDQEWQAVTPEVATLEADDSGDSMVINNAGDVDAYPTYRITPRDFKNDTGYWQYKQFVAVRWLSPNDALDYPICLTGSGLDTAALVSDGKAGNAERSFGVLVDGTEVDRWFGGPPETSGGYNHTSTKVWVNLDFGPTRTAALQDVLGTGALTEIDCQTDISQFPERGILYDPDNPELFVYDGKDHSNNRFLNVRRAQYGTTAVSHDNRLELIQHEIWIVYANGLSVAKVQDDSKQPMISLGESSNTQWKWDGFGSSSRPNRSASWKPVTHGFGQTYTGVFDTTPTDPFEVIGVKSSGGNELNSGARWQIYLPCGISAYGLEGSDFIDSSSGIYLLISTDGANWETLNSAFGQGQSGWSTWAMNDSGLENRAYRYLAISTDPANPAFSYRADMYSAILAFMSSIGGGEGYTPDAHLMEEQTNYALELEIANLTTGESIELDFPLMDLDETLEVDTVNKTVIYLKDGSNQYQALWRNSHRKDILRLGRGNNAIEVNETGLVDLELEVEFRPRYYF